MKSIQQKQGSLLKVAAVFDKKFTDTNKTKLQNLLTTANIQLRPYMSLPYFNRAYSLFIMSIMPQTKNASQKDLLNPQESSRFLIKHHWNAALAQAKKEWEAEKKKQREIRNLVN